MSVGQATRPPYRIGLYLGVEPGAGGMFQYAQSMLEALTCLPPERYAVTIAYADTQWSAILQRFGVQGHALRHARRGRRIADGAMALRLPRALCRWLGLAINPLVRELLSLRCDLWIFPAQESLSYQLPSTTIGTIHDLMHRYEPSFPEVSATFRHGIREHRFSGIASDCAAVLVDSETGRRQVVESYGVAAAKVHPLPYVAPSYLRETHERADFDAHYHLPRKFLFYPAQFWPHKNHLRLLEALQRARRTEPDMALVLSGGQRHAYDQVRQSVQALGLTDSVHFIGHVPDADLRGLYRRARALVMPTFFGPTNIPPLEAMATGCPAVVSDIYGMREQSGDAALYFDPRSVEDIAAQITRVWQDDALAAELARNGLARTQGQGQAAFNANLARVLELVVEHAEAQVRS